MDSLVQSKVAVSWTSLWSSAIGMVGSLERGSKSGWPLARRMGDDLLWSESQIDKCHSGKREEEEHVEAQKEWELDREHI